MKSNVDWLSVFTLNRSYVPRPMSVGVTPTAGEARVIIVQPATTNTHRKPAIHFVVLRPILFIAVLLFPFGRCSGARIFRLVVVERQSSRAPFHAKFESQGNYLIPQKIRARLPRRSLCDTLSHTEWTLCRTQRRLPPSAASAPLKLIFNRENSAKAACGCGFPASPFKFWPS